MCVHGNLIVPLLLATTVLHGLLLTLSTSEAATGDVGRQWSTEATIRRSESSTVTIGEVPGSVRTRPKRRVKDPDEKNNIESSISLWEWLKGREMPEENCMLMAIGGVASGGALTGAFVGAGIGSIFTGPGTIVGGIIGGLVGVFGGLSVGAKAGALACENV